VRRGLGMKGWSGKALTGPEGWGKVKQCRRGIVRLGADRLEWQGEDMCGNAGKDKTRVGWL